MSRSEPRPPSPTAEHDRDQPDATAGAESGTPRAPLERPDWRRIEKPDLEAMSRRDWDALLRQEQAFYREHQAEHVLRALSTMKDDASVGYEINNYQHCLQSATMVLRDGHDEETVVVALLHDLGFTLCPSSHGLFAAALLAPYVHERHVWMLQRHGIFQDAHAHHHPDADPQARERWRGHPYFAWTAEYVARYDQNAIRADYDTAPLEVFAPMVRRLLAREPRQLELP